MRTMQAFLLMGFMACGWTMATFASEYRIYAQLDVKGNTEIDDLLEMIQTRLDKKAKFEIIQDSSHITIFKATYASEERARKKFKDLEQVLRELLTGADAEPLRLDINQLSIGRYFMADGSLPVMLTNSHFTSIKDSDLIIEAEALKEASRSEYIAPLSLLSNSLKRLLDRGQHYPSAFPHVSIARVNDASLPVLVEALKFFKRLRPHDSFTYEVTGFYMSLSKSASKQQAARSTLEHVHCQLSKQLSNQLSNKAAGRAARCLEACPSPASASVSAAGSASPCTRNSFSSLALDETTEEDDESPASEAHAGDNEKAAITWEQMMTSGLYPIRSAIESVRSSSPSIFRRGTPAGAASPYRRDLSASPHRMRPSSSPSIGGSPYRRDPSASPIPRPVARPSSGSSYRYEPSASPSPSPSPGAGSVYRRDPSASSSPSTGPNVNAKPYPTPSPKDAWD